MGIRIYVIFFLLLLMTPSLNATAELNRRHSDVIALYNRGLYSEALYNGISALDLAYQRYGTDHIRVAQVQNTMGSIQIALGDYDQAIQYLSLSLSTIRKHKGSQHIQVAVALENLGNAHRLARNYTSAVPLLNEAHKIRQETYGEYSIEAATSIIHLSRLYYEMGQLPLGDSHYQRALRLYKRHFDEFHPKVADVQDIFFSVYPVSTDVDTLLPLYNQILAIEISNMNRNHPNVGHMYERLANWHLGNAMPESALLNYRKSLKIFNRHRHNFSIKVINISYKIGRLYNEVQRPKKAIPYLTNAATSTISLFGTEDPQLRPIYSELKESYRQLGRKNQIKVMTEKLNSLPTEL
jgi:tetratricopeptide (TPR) repeat protein